MQRLHRRTREIFVMFCMTLMVVLAAQGAVIVVDRSQHAMGLDHAATPLAGPVHYDHDHHDGDHDAVLADLAPDPVEDQDDGEARGPHHHVAEGPQLTIATEARLASLVLARTPMIGILQSDGAMQRVAGRLERPPKAALKTFA